MKLLLFFFAALLWASTTPFAGAEPGDATWREHPTVSGDWNYPFNWMQDRVPTNIAFFARSTITAVSLSAPVELPGITFNAGADAYTIIASPGTGMSLNGQGIVNASETTQNFVSLVSGDAAGGFVFFAGTITGSVAFTQLAAQVSAGQVGAVQFEFGATAGDATFHNLGAITAGAAGGQTDFYLHRHVGGPVHHHQRWRDSGGRHGRIDVFPAG